MSTRIHAGKLDKRIVFETLSVVRDDFGDETETWTPLATGAVWAAVEPLLGEERYTADQLEERITHRVTVRKSTDIAAVDATSRIVWGSRTMNIRSVINPVEDDVMLIILAEEPDP